MFFKVNNDINIINEFAAQYNIKEKHSERVTKYSLMLFDKLKKIHKLSAKSRYLLEVAALLHDIGYYESSKSHHKRSQNMIMNATSLPFNKRDRLLIGNICRYHGKAIPNLKHTYYSLLSSREKLTISKIIALLKIADGLDERHLGIIRDIQIKISSQIIYITLYTVIPADQECERARVKGAFFKSFFLKDIYFDYKIIGEENYEKE